MTTTRNKKQTRHAAQDEIMQWIDMAITRQHDDENIDHDLISEMTKQMARVEKMFGYTEAEVA